MLILEIHLLVSKHYVSLGNSTLNKLLCQGLITLDPRALKLFSIAIGCVIRLFLKLSVEHAGINSFPSQRQGPRAQIVLWHSQVG